MTKEYNDELIQEALSLLQPWASLVVLGEKRMETRGYPTKFRGRLAIHASKKFTALQRALFYSKHFQKAFANHGITSHKQLPLGALIGEVDVTDCCKITLSDITDVDTQNYPNLKYFNPIGLFMNTQEYDFGDYNEGRYAWYLAKPIEYSTFKLCKGSITPIIWNIAKQMAA